MSNYSYIAIDPRGIETRGMLEVTDQTEAVRRIKEMGLFPTKVLEAREPGRSAAPRRGRPVALTKRLGRFPVIRPRVGSARLSVFTRQLATLVEAGMPLLRSLRTLEEQEENHALKRIVGDLGVSIEGGSCLAEAVAQHPKVFNRLYVNMVKAGEIGGALEVTLGRLAEFMEKAQKIKGKIKAAMFYPCAVLLVASAILVIMMAFVVPRFKLVFDGLLNGASLPLFTQIVFHVSDVVTHNLPLLALTVAAAGVLLALVLRTAWGRWSFDRFKLSMPVLGPLFRKLAISRFARTLGTLVSNGVPILQALSIVKETAGNVVVGRLISTVHENVKQGEPLAPTLKASPLFPAMVAGMVDVGEQTGALPEMLMKIADNYDDEVENAAGAMASLLEPIMIVFLAVIVGSIVVAVFLPLIYIVTQGFDNPGGHAGAE
jgi:type IV pilus assembly protein PilC